MTLTANQYALTKLYLASFARAPETGGLNYWSTEMAGGKGMNDIVKTVFSLPIVMAIYPDAMSNNDFLTAVYKNCFGKLPDADGLAYWANQLVNGAARSSLVMTMIDAGLGTPGGTPGKDYISNRIESAQYAVAQQLAQNKEIAVQKLIDIMATVNADATTRTAASIAIDQYSGAKVQGKLADGYIKGATVFADTNGDGIWNQGEAITTTDDQGNFVLTGAKGPIIGRGGIDLSTNQEFKGELKAPEGSSVINPLTSLQQGFVERGQNIEQAAASVAKALGFDASKIDLQNFDPLSAALNTTASAETKSLGAQLQAEAAKVANLLVTASTTLVGAAGGAANISQIDAAKAVLESIVSHIATRNDGIVSLTDKTFLQSVLVESITQSNNTALTEAASKVTSMASSFAVVAAASAEKVNAIYAAGGDTVMLLAQIAQTQSLSQGDMATRLLNSAASGNLSSVESSFTGTALNSAVSKATIGELAPGNETVSKTVAAVNEAAVTAATPPASGGSGGGTTTTPPTVTPAAVSKNLDSLLGSFSAPATFDAASGDGIFNFSDSVATASYTRITNFGVNDAIAITDGGSNHLVVANRGADVVFTVNDNGTVSQITLVGVSTDTAIIGSLSAFNALGIGDVGYS
ncbi:MAG: DUF4214 domain-containing protein [Sterolibacterium sp.]